MALLVITRARKTFRSARLQVEGQAHSASRMSAQARRTRCRSCLVARHAQLCAYQEAVAQRLDRSFVLSAVVTLARSASMPSAQTQLFRTQHHMPLIILQIKIGEGGTIQGADLNKIKAGGDGIGLRMYDPGYVNTTAVISRICFIDGAKGILRYRGYPIEQARFHSACLACAGLPHCNALMCTAFLGAVLAAGPTPTKFGSVERQVCRLARNASIKFCTLVHADCAQVQLS